MRATTPLLVLLVVVCAVAAGATANADVDTWTVEAGRAIIEGKIDEFHDLVLRIDRGAKPVEWRIRGRGDDFQVAVEASGKIPLEGGKAGHGFVVTVKQATSKVVIHVALTEGNPVVGSFAIRRKADFVAENGVLTFADIALKDGKKLSVSLRLEPRKR